MKAASYMLFSLLERRVSLALGSARSEKAGLQAVTVKGTKAQSHPCPRLSGRGSKWGSCLTGQKPGWFGSEGKGWVFCC